LVAESRAGVSVVEAFDDALVGSSSRSVAISCRKFRRQS
jgi:hypothetical protein